MTLTRMLHIEDAEKYLALADDLIDSAQYEQPRPAPRARDAYIMGRAQIIGMLAHFKGEPYRAEYVNAYENALVHLQNENGAAVATGLVPYLRYWYAGHLLLIDGNTEAAQEQLSQATAEALAYKSEYRKLDSLSSVLRNIKVVAPVFEAPIAHAELLKISPELTTLYESL